MSKVLEIKKTECVGDSSAIHNYNCLILDTMICNLSSTLFNIDDNYSYYFKQYAKDIPMLLSAYEDFNSDKIFRYKITKNAVEYLSAYWNKHEFTVQLNTNISPIYSSRIIGSFLESDFPALCSASYNYLMTKFPPLSYMTNTKAHVVAYHYTTIQTEPISAVQVTCTPQDFSNTDRYMRVDITKQSMNISAANIFSFINYSKNNWVLVDVLPALPKNYKIVYDASSNESSIFSTST
jgi:hypothetical protein